MHYVRWQRHGDPLHVDQIQDDDVARFMSKVDQHGPVAKNNPELGSCWIWLAYRDPNGYGKIGKGREVVMLAHRFGYETFVGPIPDGMQLDHFACDNGPGGCCNPAHVRPTTGRENVLRGNTIAARNASRTHCPHGHAYDETNTYVERDGSRRCRTCKNDRYRRKALTNVTD